MKRIAARACNDFGDVMSIAAKYSDLPVSAKVVSAFSIVLVSTIALGLLSVLRLSQLDGRGNEISDHWLQAAHTY